ncbi:DNA-processing protein DprA [Pseudoalteromonas sp. MMG013]|uniref:DNA-processing protein DprA n=1 Tax=Pseudoalteromonas sp. MMG013 TaxID=2822687 RepID=UPI001B384820|nr:DNA-processing protein DprA [Pseudoalteromonas sp. MMG013]MBQ4864096.1 DNA-processing protein DprA [Pseudoalteromonas sp. MMG013]
MSQLSLSRCMALYLCKGLGLSSIKALMDHGDLNHLFNLNIDELKNLGLAESVAVQLVKVDWQYIDALISHCETLSIAIVSYFDSRYPPLLKQICTAPLLLFCRGNIDLLVQPQIAIVGSRSATATGLEIAAEFSYQLTQSGLVVTSGLARGVDGAAHKGALAHLGETIAVLGTGTDIIYPKRHQQLYQQIIERGLVVSEFLPGTLAKACNFPRRNRIISGLSLGVLLVEAEIKSGSLITARYALEQNREVFAIPGSIKNPLSQGGHFLLKQGAKLTEHVSDILEEVSFLPENSLYTIESMAKNDISQEDCRVLQNLGFEVTSVDTLTQRTQWPVEKVVARLLDLELEDKVERVLNGYIKLARG